MVVMNVKLKQIEAYFYYQDEKHATVLIVDYQRKLVRKIADFPPEICMNDDSMQYLSVEAANVLFLGLNKAFFMVQFEGFNGSKPEPQKERLMLFFEKINNKVNQPDYFAIIQEEYRLYDVFGEKRLAFSDAVDKHNESILKMDKEYMHEAMKGFTVEEDVPEAQRIDMLIEKMTNPEESGYAAMREKMQNCPGYKESNELAKKIQPAFMDFFKALIDIENHTAKEYELYTDKYKEKLDYYADQGLFLYCQNTPDLPVDDDDVSIDDFYEYYLTDDAMYLKNTFETFVVNAPAMGEINMREANDIVASFNLLLEGKYWASLRNLYALIDHHHKLCSDIFNGYRKMRQEFRNGKARSEYIDDLFSEMTFNNYEHKWKKIDEAIEEINRGTGTRFVSRNAIIHGDYENKEVNPQAKDVINVFLIYVTMRQMVDRLANIEDALKNFELYCKAYVNLHLDKKII